MAAVINVNETIDQHPISAYQIRVLAMCMLVAALDGYDTQAIGYTAPAVAQALHLPMNAFGPVFSAALLRGALGALSFGPLADRLGRKRFMVAATVIFAVFSFLTARVTSLPELLAFRFITGLGLGGALPSFLALGGEFAPTSKRGVFVAIAFAAFPFGGLIGALISSYVIPNFGWQYVFYIGGIVPLVMTAVLGAWLPEIAALSDRTQHSSGRSAPDALAHRAERNSSRRRTHRLAGTRARGHSGQASVHRGTSGKNATAVGRIFRMLHGAGDGNRLGAHRAAQRRFLALGRRAHHRSQQCRQRLRKCAVGLSHRPLRTFQDADTGICDRRPVPRRFWASHGFGDDAGSSFDTRRLFRRRHRHRADHARGRDVPDQARSTGIGWGMGMGRIGQVFGPLGTGLLVGSGVGVEGVFYAAAIPCFLGALFVLLMKLAPGPTLQSPSLAPVVH